MDLRMRFALHFIKKKNSKMLSFTSCVSILGISFGVAAFLVVITVLTSFQAQMKHIISSVNPNLIVYSPTGIPSVSRFEGELETLLGNKATGVSPFVYQESIMGLGRNASAVYIRAIKGSHSASAKDLKPYMTPENALNSLDAPSPLVSSDRQTVLPHNVSPQNLPHVILGRELAEKLGARIGSVVTLTTFSASDEGSVPQVRYNRMFVSGTSDMGLSQYDKQSVFMNFADGVKLFGVENWASGVEVRLKDPDSALSLAKELRQKTPYHVVAWQQIDSDIFHQIQRDGTTIKLIVLVISFVAGFNIVVTLSLTVMDRAKQISLLRSLGARKSLIVSSFVLCGIILGCLGAFLGVGCGLIILKIFSYVHLGEFQQFYYLEKVPVYLNLELVGLAFFTAVLLSFLGAFYPAWRASRVSPIFGLKQGN